MEPTTTTNRATVGAWQIEEETTMSRNVEIVGAGLAGLAAACRFAQLGWRVALHERSNESGMFGAGIWLWESGLKTLTVLGAFEQATARARTIKEWRIAA